MEDFDRVLRLCDEAAEALILVDVDDAESRAELVHAFEALADAFGEVADDHCAIRGLIAARDFELGEADALGRLETLFGEVRSAAEALERSGPAEDESARAMPLAGDEELLRDFAIRAEEHLDDVDERLLALEAEPSSRPDIDAAFRAFHTIKGMAGFLALNEISEMTHSAEGPLADSRASGAPVSGEDIQTLFSAVDAIRAKVAAILPGSAPKVVSAAAGPAKGTIGDEHAERATDSTVRVDEARLDALLDAIGELVIAESMVSSSIRNGEIYALEAQTERLDKITRGLQQMATSLRMVPMRSTFRRMARLVRDLSQRAGKEVELVVSGEDTELDKVVVDRIQDPLVHALRNAVDHGIEPHGERLERGKAPTARIDLRAFHAGGSIHIEVADDGRGLDSQRILERARTQGLLEADEQPDEAELFSLIYKPGFSTAEEVTDISGRGVGMDVARRTIEELRGGIALRSESGEGTTVSFRLPVTLAIIDGMACRVGSERYVLPVLSIERSIRPTSDQLSTVHERGLMLALDDGLVPVVRLRDIFGIDDAEEDATRGVVVIVNEAGERAGLLVCELLGQQQTVIKPLADELVSQEGIAGAAIMPDGRVGLIIDAAGLVRLAHEKGVTRYAAIRG